jgi:hypothetical protein
VAGRRWWCEPIGLDRFEFRATSDLLVDRLLGLGGRSGERLRTEAVVSGPSNLSLISVSQLRGPVRSSDPNYFSEGLQLPPATRVANKDPVIMP